MQPSPPVDQSEQLPQTTDSIAPETTVGRRTTMRRWALLGVIILLCIIAVTAWAFSAPSTKTKSKQAATSPHNKTVKVVSSQGLQLNTSKNYGNKYSNGILPVGDGKYSTTEAKQGYIYTCSGYAQNLSTSQGGAGSRGPWFTNNNTEYDTNKKVHVAGSVTWQSNISLQENGGNRVITSNDLPSHPTGIFPIGASDPAHLYDRNPNSIKGQSLSYTLPINPSYGAPQCMGGEAGIMLTGVALFNGFDAGGRDAGAWEVQDGCSGHPQVSGEYHYHTLSSCIADTNITTVIGYALDGFPITGPKVGPNNILTTSDLDECHGIVSQVTIDSKKITTYHYVMTQDFPYSISCFRATPIQTAPPDGPAGKMSGPPPSRPL